MGNSPVAWIPRLFGKPVVLNVDGLDRQRKKWGWFARTYLHFCEWLSVHTPTRTVTDSNAMQNYYQSRYAKKTTMIGYGAEAPEAASSNNAGQQSVLARFGLKPKQYILYVSRLEPENNAHVVIDAFEKVETEKKLLIVGDAPYSRAYIERLKSTRDPRIRFAGAIYGVGYRELG